MMDELLYNALMLGKNKDLEDEEFLIAAGEKEPAKFSVSKEEFNISEVLNDTLMGITIEVDVEGYLEIEVSCPDNFIILERNIITTDDFEHGRYRFNFEAVAKRLHNGKNFTELVFRTVRQEIHIPVTIENRIRVSLEGDRFKKAEAELTKNYLELRMNRLSVTEWARKDLQLLEFVSGNDAESLFLMLYSAQLYMVQGMLSHAKNIMDYVSEQLPKIKEPSYDLSCYYLYIQNLYSGTEEQSEASTEQLKLVYSTVVSWKILWMLFYMDSSYSENPEKKLYELKNLFLQGCTSPEMYFEALDIYQTSPDLIEEVSDYELHVINFGLKYNCIMPTVIGRIVDIIMTMHEDELAEINIKLALKILKTFYKKNSDNNILRAICMLLVASDNRETKNNRYLAEAIRMSFTIPGLFDSYIHTLDMDSMKPIPDSVCDYFIGNTTSFYEYRSYFYANMIENQLKTDAYRRYREIIAAYADEQISIGRLDRFTGIILKDILENNLALQKLKNNLFNVICTKEVICSCPKIMSVLVFHRELNSYQDIFLEDGHAFVNIYSGDSLILFKDIAGNIYCNIEYEKKDLIETSEYIGMCISQLSINKYMFMADNFPLLKEYKDPVLILRYASSVLKPGTFRREYEEKLIKDIVLQFVKERNQEVYDELLEFRKFNLDRETRGKLVEVMVACTMYRQAYDEIAEIGIEYVSNDAIGALAHILAQLSVGNAVDPLILKLCETAFVNLPYDPDVFDYMELHYNGDIDVMIDMYRMAGAYEQNQEKIAAKIIRRAIEIESDHQGVYRIFERYYQDGSNEDLKNEYLTFRALQFLHGINKDNLEFFGLIENGLAIKTVYDDRVYVSYLFYILDYVNPSPGQLKVSEEILKDLVRRGIMLERFKEFKQYFKLPSLLANSAIVSRFVKDGIPIIKYKIEPVSMEYTEEPMIRILEGTYAKYFTLFIGENLIYSVDDGISEIVRYDDLNLVPDGSRFSQLNNLIMLEKDRMDEELKAAAKEYYIKGRLIEALFNTIN